MEFIIHVEQFEKMIDNKIIGIPKLVNTKINFMSYLIYPSKFRIYP